MYKGKVIQLHRLVISTEVDGGALNKDVAELLLVPHCLTSEGLSYNKYLRSYFSSVLCGIIYKEIGCSFLAGTSRRAIERGGLRACPI